jgi:SAM-dependent methyltransferase
MTLSRKTSCLACNNATDNEGFVAYEKMFGLGDAFAYLKCGQCHSLQIEEIPENLDRYYSSAYYTTGRFNKSHLLKNILKRLRWQLYAKKIFRKSSKPYLNWINALDINFKSKIADIGCGPGQLLYEMHCAGFRNLHGFDPHVYEEILLPGLTVKKVPMDKIQGDYDVVMMHHSFEHMAEPREVFSLLGNLVRKNGQLLIRTPVADAAVWKEEGINWFQIDAPRHLFIPSVQAMLGLAQDNGFMLSEVVFDSDENQFLISQHYKNGGSLVNFDIKKVDKLDLDAAKHKSKLYNEQQIGDQACFYFVKQA